MSMDETARERVIRSTGVTAEMVDCAEKVLGAFGISQLAKKFSNRDVLYEIISAAMSVKTGVSEDALVRDEVEWTQYFKKCRVVVRDPEVGQQLLKLGLGSPEAFKALVETIAQSKAIVVPLEKYPGISLFKEKLGREEEVAETE